MELNIHMEETSVIFLKNFGTTFKDISVRTNPNLYNFSNLNQQIV